MEVCDDGQYVPLNDYAKLYFERCDVLPSKNTFSEHNLDEILKSFQLPNTNDLENQESDLESDEENPESDLESSDEELENPTSSVEPEQTVTNRVPEPVVLRSEIQSRRNRPSLTNTFKKRESSLQVHRYSVKKRYKNVQPEPYNEHKV
jgi:hypothetical protein